MSKFSTDNRDKRSGAYDPINKDGLPQPHQVKDRTTSHEAVQPGVDVRADALPGTVATESTLRATPHQLARKEDLDAT
jgi:hypothetical protein